MQALKLKYLGTEIEPDPEPQLEEAGNGGAAPTASDIASQWDNVEQDDDMPAEEYIFDESDTQEFTSGSDDSEE